MSGRWKGLAAAGAVALVAVAPAVGDHHDDGWWGPPRDVRRALDRVDARSLQRYDHALVGFGTRHTLSVQDDPARGIGAARDYIKSQFDQIVQTAGGRMTVELQSFIQPVSPRVPVPTRL